MNISEYFFSSLDALRTNKLRSGLSLIGIIVGVSSVVVLVGLGNGMKEKIIKSFSATNNIISIVPGPDFMIQMASTKGGNQPTTEPYEVTSGKKFVFSESMVDRLRSFRLPHVKAVVPVYNTVNTQVLFEGKKVYASILPLSDDFRWARDLKIQSGIWTTEVMKHKQAKTVIIGFSTVESNFEGVDPLGKEISFGGQVFTIIGILKKTGDYMVDQTFFVPIEIAKPLFGLKDISKIEITVDNVTKIREIQEFLRAILSRYLERFATEIYHFETNERFLKEMQQSINSVTLFIVGIAGISLLVGGIGIMNVMLVSVTERTREIGIRKAIGATWIDILIQFLIESGTITGIGGVMAVILSYIIGFGIEKFVPSMAFSIDITVVICATLFSVLMGIIFGILPAWKASRMQPIDALRFE